MQTSETFSRIWSAFDEGQIVATCAWCGRVWIDEAWVSPPAAALAAVDTDTRSPIPSATRAANALVANAGNPTRQGLRRSRDGRHVHHSRLYVSASALVALLVILIAPSSAAFVRRLSIWCSSYEGEA